MAEELPYQLSRSALRKRYGSRAITSGGQSAQDYTPSGRAKYLAEESARTGLTPAEIAAPRKSSLLAAQQARAEFKQGLGPQQQIIEPIISNVPPVGAPLRSRQGMQAGGLASPEDVGQLRQQGASGVINTPYGTVTLGLLPQTASADALAPFSDTASPLTSFSLPKPKTPFVGSLLQNTSPWRKPIFG